jgi:hypothetical protein
MSNAEISDEALESYLASRGDSRFQEEQRSENPIPIAPTQLEPMRATQTPSGDTSSIGTISLGSAGSHHLMVPVWVPGDDDAAWQAAQCHEAGPDRQRLAADGLTR